MPEQLYLQLTANAQGKIKGSVVSKGHEGQIEVLASEHLIEVPITTAGRRSGKANHGPIIITKWIDKATVPLYTALCNNEVITEFKLDYYKPQRSGVMKLYYTIELKNANITSIKQTMAGSGFTDAAEREIVAFTYQEITWTFADGGITANSSSASRV